MSTESEEQFSMRRIQRNGMECNAMQCNIQHVMVSAVMEHFIVLTSLVSWKVTFVVHCMGSHGSHAPVPRLRNTKRTSGMAQDDAHSVTYRWKLEDRHRTMIVCAAGNIAPSRSCSAMLFYCERSVFRDPPKK